MSGYDVIEGKSVHIKAWTKGVQLEDSAREQLKNVASLPFIHRHIAVMPDVHWGMGATVGSVIPTVGAIIPAAVGVDIGCGMMAVKTSIRAEHLPDDLAGHRRGDGGASRLGRDRPHLAAGCVRQGVIYGPRRVPARPKRLFFSVRRRWPSVLCGPS